MPQAEYLQYGGQAIVEGVMMRSPRYFAVACRAPNGDIVLQTEALEKTWIGRQKWLKLPFLRGSLALLDAMALGIKAMKFASNVQLDEKFQPVKEAGEAEADAKPADKTPSKSVQSASVAVAMFLGIVIGLFIFNFLPNLLSEQLRRFGTSPTIVNLVTEILKLIIFVGYIWMIGRLPEIREVFKYHGAEHKAINTMEASQPLDIETCQAQTRFHPRCGTSFAVIVLLISLLVFTFVPRYPFGESASSWANVSIRVLMEIAILPIVAGISYELLRIAGKFRSKRIVDAAFKPGIWTQRLTTNEPEGHQVEVALVALKAVIHAEETGELRSDSGAVLNEKLEIAEQLA